MEEKELILRVISLAIKGGYSEILDWILGKCCRYSELSTLLNRTQVDCYILGRGVIFLKDGFLENIDYSFLENISDNFIEISNEKQYEEFKKILESEVQKKMKVKENEKASNEEVIMAVINEEVPAETEENKKNLLNLVKSAEGRPKEELLSKMDSAYEIIPNQGKVTRVFMANPKLKISKNTYNRKEREKVINNGR